MIRLGSAFDLRGVGFHLRVVVSDPNASGFVLVCNITDIVHVPDCGCRFEPGDHERITKPTGIELRRLLELSAEGIEQAIREGHLISRADFRTDLVTKIQRAILDSKFVSPKLKSYL